MHGLQGKGGLRAHKSIRIVGYLVCCLPPMRNSPARARMGSRGWSGHGILPFARLEAVGPRSSQLGRVFKPRVPRGFPGLPEKLRDRQRTSSAEAGQCCANMVSSRPCRSHNRVNNGRRPGDGITMQSHFTSLARGEGVALEMPKQANRLLAHGAH